MASTTRFSGRQITIMVVAVCVAAILAPAGAVAAGSATTTVADPSNPALKAHVTGKGSLAVTPRDPVTGSQARVNAAGQQLVNGSVSVTTPITGSVSISNHPDVTTHAGLPGTPFTAHGYTNNGNGATVTVPAGHTLVVQSVSVYMVLSGASSEGGFILYTTGGQSGQLYPALRYQYTDASGEAWLSDTEAVTFYADGGTDITLEPAQPPGSTQGPLYLAVSGYLI